MSLTEIRLLFENVKNHSGNDKAPHLDNLCMNADAVELMKVLLDSYIVFGIGEKSLQKEVAIPPATKWKDVFEMIDDLKGKTNSSNQDIANVKSFLNSIPNDKNREFVASLITKSYKMGVTAKTANKYLRKHGYEEIPVFSVMLAEKFFEHPDAVEGEYFFITEKLDGIRCMAVPQKDGSYVLFSRQGKIIKGLVDVERDLKEFYEKNGAITYDGELIISDRDKYPSKTQYKLTTNIVRSEDEEKHGITYNVFDWVPLRLLTYKTRRTSLETFFSDGNKETVHKVPVLYYGKDFSEIYRQLNKARAEQKEGVMINLADGLYEFKRTKVLLKVKVMQDCDLEITGVNEGTGKFAGTLGSLTVSYKGNSVGVGSGLSDDMRKEIWSCPEKYIGRVATIQYFEETEDADGKKSIRFPVFRELREEGKEVSYS